jgi:hypothetical protein
MAGPSSTSRTAGPGCLILFGLPFAAAGCAILIIAGRAWALYLRSGSWERLPATIESVEWVKRSGSDGPTYSVRATYTYERAGRTHTASRVGALGGSSDDYGFHRRRYDLLREHTEGRRPFPALVNPRDPDDALLFREATPWMYALVPVGLLFAGVGVSIGVAGVLAHRRRLARRRLAQATGDRPWLYRDDWRRCRVRASNAGELLTTWLLGLGLSLFMSGFLILMTGEDTPLFARIIVGGFTALAVGVVLSALSLTVRQLLHGTPVLYLAQVPILPGRSVRAVLQTARPTGAREWEVRIRCLETRVGGNQDGRGAHTAVLYEAQVPTAQPSMDRTGRAAMPLVLQVPAGATGTALEGDETVAWTLRVRAPAFPRSLTASFDLPVFYADDGEVRAASDPLPA